MADSPLTRQEIIQALRARLEPLDYVQAMWEGGAAAFNRVDEWSDIDLQVVVNDDCVAQVFPIVEDVLQSLSPIDLRYEIPQPAWHGHAQVFYRLSKANRFLLIDLVVIKKSNPLKFLEPEIHGNAVVHFDQSDVTKIEPLDRVTWNAKLRERVNSLRITFDLFQALTLKELNRHNSIEALAFYNGYTLRPLVEALRILYAPTRYNFNTRYVHYDLPAEVVRRLEKLFFVQNENDLRAKQIEADKWFCETVEQIRLD